MGLGSDADPAMTAQRWEAGNGRRRSRVAGFGDLHPWQLMVGGTGWPLGDRELEMRERKTGKEEGKEKGGERGPDRGGCRHRRGTRSGDPLPFLIDDSVARGGLDPIWIERCRRLGRADGCRIPIWRTQMDGWEAGLCRIRLVVEEERGEGWSGGGEGTDHLGIRV